jgi:hypothetical protein
MPAPQNFAIRLSPSGPFITDAQSGEPLLVGVGTPGLIWRGQYVPPQGNNTDIGGTVPVVIPGMGGDWELPIGYHYDIEAFMTIQDGVGGTANTLQVFVEASIDNGATWPIVLLNTSILNWAPGMASQCADCIHVGKMDLDWTNPAAAQITNIRTRALGFGTTGVREVVVDSWLKIEQYIT